MSGSSPRCIRTGRTDPEAAACDSAGTETSSTVSVPACRLHDRVTRAQYRGALEQGPPRKKPQQPTLPATRADCQGELVELETEAPARRNRTAQKKTRGITLYPPWMHIKPAGQRSLRPGPLWQQRPSSVRPRAGRLTLLIRRHARQTPTVCQTRLARTRRVGVRKRLGTEPTRPRWTSRSPRMARAPRARTRK